MPYFERSLSFLSTGFSVCFQSSLGDRLNDIGECVSFSVELNACINKIKKTNKSGHFSYEDGLDTHGLLVVI